MNWSLFRRWWSCFVEDIDEQVYLSRKENWFIDGVMQYEKVPLKTIDETTMKRNFFFFFSFSYLIRFDFFHVIIFFVRHVRSWDFIGVGWSRLLDDVTDTFKLTNIEKTKLFLTYISKFSLIMNRRDRCRNDYDIRLTILWIRPDVFFAHWNYTFIWLPVQWGRRRNGLIWPLRMYRNDNFGLFRDN